MKCLDFQLVNYFRFQQLDVHDARTRRHKIVRFSLHLRSQQAGHERSINCSYTWFFRRQRFPHHFTVKREVLQEYFRMIRLFPISLDCRISNKGLFGCCKRWSFAVGKRNERYQVSPKREKNFRWIEAKLFFVKWTLMNFVEFHYSWYRSQSRTLSWREQWKLWKMFLTFKKCTNFDIQNKKFDSKDKHHLSEI